MMEGEDQSAGKDDEEDGWREWVDGMEKMDGALDGETRGRKGSGSWGTSHCIAGNGNEMLIGWRMMLMLSVDRIIFLLTGLAAWLLGSYLLGCLIHTCLVAWFHTCLVA